MPEKPNTLTYADLIELDKARIDFAEADTREHYPLPGARLKLIKNHVAIKSRRKGYDELQIEVYTTHGGKQGIQGLSISPADFKSIAAFTKAVQTLKADLDSLNKSEISPPLVLESFPYKEIDSHNIPDGIVTIWVEKGVVTLE